MSAFVAWSYQAAYRPPSYSNQCYYRSRAQQGWNSCMLTTQHGRLDVDLWRFDDSQGATLRFDNSVVGLNARLNTAELLALRDAINDALADIATLTPQMPAEVFA